MSRSIYLHFKSAIIGHLLNVGLLQRHCDIEADSQFLIQWLVIYNIGCFFNWFLANGLHVLDPPWQFELAGLCRWHSFAISGC